MKSKIVHLSFLLLVFSAVLGHDIVYGYHDLPQSDCIHHQDNQTTDSHQDCGDFPCMLDWTSHVFQIPQSDLKIGCYHQLNAQTEFFPLDKEAVKGPLPFRQLIVFGQTETEYLFQPLSGEGQLRAPPIT